jgi:sporulation protein YlmC with PRC-barrel domain
MLSRQILDKEVVGFNGWKIGKSKEIIIDSQNWQVTHIEVELNDNIMDELSGGIPLHRTRIPIEVSFVQGIGDLITLKVTKEEIISVLATYSKNRQSEEPQKGPVVV